ncbi:hypothetical protein ACFPPF_16410 [Xenophilus aerolatus]|nr:hypothetical protein [Xenophilus aerolatus]
MHEHNENADDEEPSHAEVSAANRRLTRVLGDALQLDDEGNTAAAVSKLRGYLEAEISTEHREIAQSEISRMLGTDAR